MQNGMFEYVRSRIQSVTISIVDNLRVQYLDLALGKWIWFAEEHRKWKIAGAGPLLTRVCTGYFARLKYLKLRSARRHQLELDAKVRIVRNLGMDDRAIRIQSQIRRFLALRHVTPILRRDRASRYIQAFLRSWTYMKRDRREYLTRLRKQAATFLLQRVTRGFIGRRVSK